MTKRGKLLPTLLVACALMFVAAGCGVDSKSDAGGDTPTTVDTTTEPEETTTEPEATTTEPEETTTEPEATTTEPERPTTTAPTTGTTLPESLNDAFRDSLEQGFVSAGLSPEQAKCMADGYLEKFGTDVSASTDISKITPLFTECKVNPSDFGG